MVKKTKKSTRGRKLFDGKDEERVVQKLEAAFSLDCTDEEACFYGDISTSALYEYQKKHPEFLERKKRFKQRPVFAARKSVVEALSESPTLALQYLERKRKSEFAVRSEFTGEDGKKLEGVIIVRPEEYAEYQNAKSKQILDSSPGSPDGSTQKN